MEMTGLDVLTCHILEVACLITDAQLNVLAQGPDLIINQPDHILDNMDTWCVQHHGQCGWPGGDLHVLVRSVHAAQHQWVGVGQARSQHIYPWLTFGNYQSGLTDACRKSKISLQDAEHSLMAFIKTYIPKGSFNSSKVLY
uniref:(California timema) hypothetical protein n=1 Tax=Timema californicum TaxID=61474 RepID=A0A7R9PFF5_TIMCA|nr:unnamed protein product [Timema californicum]